MIAEIITVGTEILLGNIINTNATFLSKKCASLGLFLYHQQSVGDNINRIVEAIKLASKRADVIILSGGLGPTSDDITRDALSIAINKKLILDENIARNLEAYFIKKGRKMTENNLRQAMIIEDAKILNNINGTAVGMIVNENNKIYILLPGPPIELEKMIDDVVEYLKDKTDGIIYSHVLKLCNASESLIEMQIKDLIDNQSNPTIAPYAKIGQVDIRISAFASNEKEAEKLILPIENEIKQRFSDLIFTSSEDISLQMYIVELLRKRNNTLAVAESCTGGMLSSDIVNVSGSSDVFLMGLVTYSNDAKKKLLNVSDEILNKYGAVSEKTAIAMVKGLIEKSGANAGISITGIAGPNSDNSKKPVGLVYIATYYLGDIKVNKFNFLGNRENIRRSASTYAIICLKEHILGR